MEPNGRLQWLVRGSASSPPASVPGLLARNREAGLEIDTETARCGWRGETMDYGLAIEHLIQVRDRATPAAGAGAVPLAR